MSIAKRNGLTFYPFCSSLQLQCENLRQQPRVDLNSQKYLLFTAYAIQERRQTEEKAWGVQSAAGGPDPRQVSTHHIQMIMSN